jgi:hypothetical protein
MTGSNWPGFGNDKRVGSQFFVLLDDTWPNKFEQAVASTTIVHPIETLFREVLSHARASLSVLLPKTLDHKEM